MLEGGLVSMLYVVSLLRPEIAHVGLACLALVLLASEIGRPGRPRRRRIAKKRRHAMALPRYVTQPVADTRCWDKEIDGMFDRAERLLAERAARHGAA